MVKKQQTEASIMTGLSQELESEVREVNVDFFKLDGCDHYEGIRNDTCIISPNVDNHRHAKKHYQLDKFGEIWVDVYPCGCQLFAYSPTSTYYTIPKSYLQQRAWEWIRARARRWKNIAV